MENKRLVEHYRDHEITCSVAVAAGGWRYTVSVVHHQGDDSDVRELKSRDAYRSDIEALGAGMVAGRASVDAGPIS